MKITFIHKYAPLFLISFFITACQADGITVTSTKTVAEKTHVSGIVKFPKADKPLSADTTVLVKLSDVSLMDAAEVVVSKQSFNIKSTNDLSFSLSYDANKIRQGHRYAVSARIELHEKLLYINDTHIGVIYNGKTRNITLPVVSVSHLPFSF